jgi:cell division protein FtsB
MAMAPPRFLRSYQERARFRQRVRRLLAWSIVPVLGWMFVVADGGLISIVTRRLRIVRLHARVETLERRQALLEQSIARRESDAGVLERLARERYGMARPGETVYRIVEVSDAEARRIERERRAIDRAERRRAPAH